MPSVLGDYIDKKVGNKGSGWEKVALILISLFIAGISSYFIMGQKIIDIDKRLSVLSQRVNTLEKELNILRKQGEK